MLGTELVGGLGPVGQAEVLQVATEKGVVVDLLRQEDHAGGGDGVGGAPAQRARLLAHAVHDDGGAVALHAHAQAVPTGLV